MLGHSQGGDAGKELVKTIFHDAKDNMLTTAQLFNKCNSKEINQALRATFKGMGLLEVCSINDVNGDANISEDEFIMACEKAAFGKRKLKWGGIYFPVAQNSQGEAGSSFVSEEGFPHSVGPFSFAPVQQINPSDLHFSKEPSETNEWFKHGRTCHLRADAFRGELLQRILQSLPGDRNKVHGQLSALRSVSVPQRDRAAANIPKEAAYYVFSYPFPAAVWCISNLGGISSLDLDVAFLTVGGFVYLNKKYEPIGINAVQLSDSGDSTVMRFDKGRKLSEERVQEMLDRPDLESVTLRGLNELKATHFCWISSDQVGRSSDADNVFSKLGGFAYLGLGLGDDLE